MARIVTYECTQCGSEIVVTEGPETDLTPIYCCGIAVAEVTPGRKKTAPKAGTKKTKKTVSRKATPRKTGALKKKPGKK